MDYDGTLGLQRGDEHLLALDTGKWVGWCMATLFGFVLRICYFFWDCFSNLKFWSFVDIWDWLKFLEQVSGLFEQVVSLRWQNPLTWCLVFYSSPEDWAG